MTAPDREELGRMGFEAIPNRGLRTWERYREEVREEWRCAGEALFAAGRASRDEEVAGLRKEGAASEEVAGALWSVFGPLVEMLDKAENWAGIDREIDGARWTISAQKADGKTPVERISELNAEIEAAHNALDEAKASRAHVETDGDFDEVVVERRPLTLAERIADVDRDRHIAWGAHETAMADVARLTRELAEVTAERDDLARRLDAHRREEARQPASEQRDPRGPVWHWTGLDGKTYTRPK